ncbi:tetratricopeptide repeat protein 16 isoform X3 [Peromyscus maniculatus bairdii]|uniref:tetratricopeptide repeat protein 16 isoform X3 n=1 Tax=Peromyscus maniculatus bairdii TaxID=230844 RepID=UPI001C2E7A1B|nr:tetratricopeptide repeat protein 16 isoform X3 [Peromyscus maniculatus bairdii]XP_042130784.1 tetratricopeptide repeat protein 16 isoform X3 [Peromyscus maniculatus bairdii]XP_042130785.1 tetratricopeptide repeat protein 16 isoform X3 [Peromyscus maniculatus bairdii]
MDNAHPQKIPKLQVPEAPGDTLQRIFGTSQVFYSMSDMKARMTGSTVPVKVKEYYHQGHVCLEQEDWEMAVLFFSRALHLDPQLVDFYVFRAEAFIQLCDFSSALQNLRRAYSYQPDNTKYLERLAFVLYLQGQCLYELCDFQEALYVFLQASDLQPQNPSFSYRCIACLLALKRHQDCLSLITREVKQGRASADVYILRARIYNFFQKAKLCYQDLRSALLFDPMHPQAKGLLQMMVDQAKQSLQDASILAVQGKLHRALRRISCAIENNPLDPNLFLFRGTLYRRLQQFDPAVEDFLKALDMVTDSQDSLVQKVQRQLLLTYNDFAVHCYTQGAYQEGVLLLNKAIRDEQNEKGLYINRGDCFFQLGNLSFAEADYKQALALSPHDEGANIRMGVLQEKMGFCEQTRRQFQMAEEHFTSAIKHNPDKAQYYLHRAKSRQLLQNTLGARQDVATVLLLNPSQPKMAPLMNNLFPGMTVEEVLHSQVAHLAKLQLRRTIESSPRTSHPQSIVAQRLMERQKARALLESWNQKHPFSEIPEEEVAIFQTPQDETLEDKTKVKREEAEEKKVKIPRKVTSLSDSYVDQSSSGSVFSILSMSTFVSETTTSQEYWSSSNTAVTSSEYSQPKSSQPRKQAMTTTTSSQGLSRAPKVIQFSDLNQCVIETTPPCSQKRHSSKAEAPQSPKPKPKKTGPPRSPGKQGPGQSCRVTEAPEGPKSSKKRADLSPRQRVRRAKAVRAQSWKVKSQKSAKTSSKTLLPHGRGGSNSSEAQSQSSGPSKAEEASSYTESTATSSSKADTFSDPSSHLGRPKHSQDQSLSPGKAELSPTPSHSAAP